MRHKPDRIDRIAMKAAAELIINAAIRHFVQREFDNSQSLIVAGSLVISEQKL